MGWHDIISAVVMKFAHNPEAGCGQGGSQAEGGAGGGREFPGAHRLAREAAGRLNGLIGLRPFNPDRFRRRAAPAPLAEDRRM